MKVIVAYDGSEQSEAALDDLGQAGLPGDCDVEVITVAEPWQEPVAAAGESSPLERSSVGRDDAMSTARWGLDRIAREFPRWRVSALGFAGSPARIILERADAVKADLIIVGRHGRGGRMVIGSIAQRVFAEARCSVRIVRPVPGHESGPPRLLLAIDGSPDADRVVEEIERRSWPEHTKVWIVTSIGFYDIEEEMEARRHAGDLHGRVAERLHRAGLATASIVEATDPRDAILMAARENLIDCIFLGPRGLTPYERSLLGSISTAVAARADCSVEVVRHPKR